MNKESERSVLTTFTSYFCNTQNRRMGHWVDSSAFSGRSRWLLLFWIYVNSHSQAYIHTYMHVHIVAHSCWPIRWVRTLPPKGQTADLCSSAEFICQLEIAHGAGKHTYIHTQTHIGVRFISARPRQTVNGIKMIDIDIMSQDLQRETTNTFFFCGPSVFSNQTCLLRS